MECVPQPSCAAVGSPDDTMVRMWGNPIDDHARWYAKALPAPQVVLELKGINHTGPPRGVSGVQERAGGGGEETPLLPIPIANHTHCMVHIGMAMPTHMLHVCPWVYATLIAC